MMVKQVGRHVVCVEVCEERWERCGGDDVSVLWLVFWFFGGVFWLFGVLTCGKQKSVCACRFTEICHDTTI